MRRKLFQRSLLPLAALMAASLSFAQESRDIVIQNARIEIGDGRVIERGIIVIRNGRIAAVGEAVEVPPQYEAVDAKGMTVYPGFIDGYTNRGLKLPDPPDAPSERDTRTTAPPTMWAENRKGIRPDVMAAKSLDLKDNLTAAHRQGFTAALLAPGGGSLRGTAAIAAYSPQTSEENLLNPVFAHSMSFRPGTGAGYPGSLMGIIAMLRQALHDARTYGRVRAVANDSGDKDADAGWEALQAALNGGMPVVFLADTDREVGRAINIADEFSLRLILAGAREAFRIADVLKQRDIPVFVSAAIGTEPSLEVREGQTDAPPRAVREERHAQWKERAQNALRLHEAGVRWGFSSDGDSLNAFLGNVRRVIQQGLPRDVALQALAKNNAEILGLNDVGTIATGKRAHLVIMDGDFANEKTTVQMVFVDGERFQLAKEGDDK
jgi:imidazolonepropionase-like amidohydrolase